MATELDRVLLAVAPASSPRRGSSSFRLSRSRQKTRPEDERVDQDGRRRFISAPRDACRSRPADRLHYRAEQRRSTRDRGGNEPTTAALDEGDTDRRRRIWTAIVGNLHGGRDHVALGEDDHRLAGRCLAVDQDRSLAVDELGPVQRPDRAGLGADIRQLGVRRNDFRRRLPHDVIGAASFAGSHALGAGVALAFGMTVGVGIVVTVGVGAPEGLGLAVAVGVGATLGAVEPTAPIPPLPLGRPSQATAITTAATRTRAPPRFVADDLLWTPTRVGGAAGRRAPSATSSHSFRSRSGRDGSIRHSPVSCGRGLRLLGARAGRGAEHRGDLFIGGTFDGGHDQGRSFQR